MLQAAEDALLGEMAAVKAGMERRQKREKRRKLEQKKKSRIRAAQAAAGTPFFTLCTVVSHICVCGHVHSLILSIRALVSTRASSLPVVLHSS